MNNGQVLVRLFKCMIGCLGNLIDGGLEHGMVPYTVYLIVQDVDVR